MPVLTEADRKRLWPHLKVEEGRAYLKWHKERYNFTCIPPDYESLGRHKMYQLLEQVVIEYQAMISHSQQHVEVSVL